MKRVRKGMNAQCCNDTKLMSGSFYNASLSYIRIFTFFSVRVSWGLRAPLLLEFFLFLFRFPKTGPSLNHMATLKQRLHKKNSSGSYDIVHLETSASLVIMSDGTTAQTAIDGKAPLEHSHSYCSQSYVDDQLAIVNANISSLTDSIQGSNGVSFSMVYDSDDISGVSASYTLSGLSFTPSRIKIATGGQVGCRVVGDTQKSASSSTGYGTFTTDHTIISNTDLSIAQGASGVFTAVFTTSGTYKLEYTVGIIVSLSGSVVNVTADVVNKNYISGYGHAGVSLINSINLSILAYS